MKKYETSVQGPQGPEVPISQKLSFIPNGRMCEGWTPSFNQTSLTLK